MPKAKQQQPGKARLLFCPRSKNGISSSNACRQEPDDGKNSYESLLHGMIVRMRRSESENGGSDASDHGALNPTNAAKYRRSTVRCLRLLIKPATNGSAMTSEISADNMIIFFPILISSTALSTPTSNDDADQTANRNYEKPDRISMMHTSRWDYLRPRRAQLKVNDSNSLDF